MKKKFLSWILTLLSCISFCLAQDIHLSQFYETPLMRNPALCGIFTGDIRVQSVYRNQWQSIGYPYTTKTLSAEYKFSLGQSEDFITIGFQTFHDIAGITRLNTIQLMPVLNYHKSLSTTKNSYLSAGFMAGIVQRSFDDRHLTFDNQYNSGRFNKNAPSGENFNAFKRNFADFAAGLSYNGELANGGNFFLGAAMYHLSKPTESFLNETFTLNAKIQGNAGVRMAISDQTEIRGEVNYLSQGTYSEIMAGGLATYHVTDMSESATNIKSVSISGGAFLRLNDAIVPVVKLNYNHLEIGLSYDVNISKLSVASSGRGGYELSISYKGFLSSQNSTLNMVRCPRF